MGAPGQPGLKTEIVFILKRQENIEIFKKSMAKIWTILFFSKNQLKYSL